MAKLAIKGHPKQGKKVIEILEMMGGNNVYNCDGSDEVYYYIDEKNIIIFDFIPDYDEFIVYTLEEFLEKFPYKVDDCVVNHKYGKGDIIQMLWIDNEIVYEIKFQDCTAYCKANELCKHNASKGLLLQELTEYLSHAKREELDKTMEEIEIALAPFKVGDKVIVKGYEKMGEDEVICVFKTYDGDIKYKTKNHLDTHYFMEDSLMKVENSYKEEGVNLQKMERNLDEALEKETTESLNKWFDEENMNTNNLCTQCVYAVDNHCGLRGFTNNFNRLYCSAQNEDKLPNGFELQPDGYFSWVDSKPQYPKTYKECFNICFGNKHHIVQVLGLDGLGGNKDLFERFIKLKICRDAYWKIAGEQMGLDKPWKPDYDNRSFIIANNNGNIHTYVYYGNNNIILAFPTAEMRNTFYENFKDLIEQCKELL